MKQIYENKLQAKKPGVIGNLNKYENIILYFGRISRSSLIFWKSLYLMLFSSKYQERSNIKIVRLC